MIKQIKWFLYSALALLFVFLGINLTVKPIDAQETITIGISGQTKPLNYFEDNELTGFEIDMLNEIDARLDDVEFEFVTTEFASLFAGLDSGQFDIVANNLGENAERREKFLFSLYPYVITHNVIITQTDQPDNLTMEDMAGMSFGVVTASPQSMFLERWNDENPDLAVDIQYVDSDPSTIIRDVHSGRFDATIYATTYLNDVQQTFGIELKQHIIENEDEINPPGSYLMYSKDDLELRNQIDDVLAEMREDGTLAEISMTYFGQNDTELSQAIIDKNDTLNQVNIASDESVATIENDLQDTRNVTIGISGQTKPLNYFEDNELTGFEIDMLNEIDARLDDVEFEFVTTEFASLFAGLDSGQFDIVANNLGENAERREKFLFSLYPYVITHNVIITQTDQPDNLTMEDMAGMSFGVVTASPQSMFLERWNDENPDLAVDIQYVDSDPSTIIRDVHSGRFDATIYATTYLNDVQQTFGIELKQHIIENEDEINPPGSYLMYSKEDLELRNQIDDVLAEMREDGTLADISMTYFGQNDTELSQAIIDKNDAINEEYQAQDNSNQTERVVTVGTSGQTKPLNYFEDNELTGFEIDLLTAIDEKLDNITFEYEITEFASLFAGLDSGQFDLVTNNLGENEERREKFLFSLYPYVITHNVIITNTEKADNLTMEDMAGMSFGVVTASPQSMFLEKWNEENPDLAVDIQYVDSDPSNLIRDVYSGRFDATIYATTYLNDVQQTFGIELKAHPIENEDAIRLPGSYFIYRLEDVELRNQMDAAIAELREDGTLAAISQKYMGQDDTQLTEEIIARNDNFEEQRLAQSDIESTQIVTQAQSTTSSTDGKIFAPEIIPQILPTILEKLPITLLMTVVSAVIGLLLGFLIALIKIYDIPILKQLATLFVSFMRGTPQLVQLFLAYYGFPLVVAWINQQLNTSINVNNIPALLYVFIAFGLNEAAYNSETIRAAILSVDKSEIEAAKSIGLTNRQTMTRIILPSAMIVAIPNLGNSLISLLKGTSLAFTVTVIDIMGQARIIAGSNLRFFEAYIAVSLIYWVCCIIIENFVKWLEKKLNVNLIDESQIQQSNNGTTSDALALDSKTK
ncbi:ABC transporter substrate-binding protein/permease [Fundicoccus culcitae]|uniref:ABC transporter substrate-binding protein/permease n=1 Tax=Fundicoccus culcitae TaxID=2969821 RepID=A0ABY5P8C2_9LACT|nr:ABC transporter substrate-binding protein/permease [Fundicoccus culcitae]UUX34633.1 ABC transporter substrate-binding protein/permease [Fundicoccus culcitae]